MLGTSSLVIHHSPSPSSTDMAVVNSFCHAFFLATPTSTFDVEDADSIVVTDGMLRCNIGRHKVGTPFVRATLSFSSSKPYKIGVALFTETEGL